jgi:hypothetical protein
MDADYVGGRGHGGVDWVAVMAKRTTWFPGAVVMAERVDPVAVMAGRMAERRGPNDSDDREDNTDPRCGGDSQAV